MPKLSFRKLCLLVFLLSPMVLAQPMELSDAIERVLTLHPRLKDDSLTLAIARNQTKTLQRSAILPKFQTTVAFGPAPGFRYNYTRDQEGNKIDSVRKYAWWPLGPFFGTEVTLAQPLNVDRYRAGLRASRAGERVERARLEAKREDEVREAIGYWFGWKYANRMVAVLEGAVHQLDSAQTVLQEKIDADEEGVTQDDLFQLKTGRYPLDKGLIEARLGRERALRGLRFALSLSDTDSVRTREPRLQALPELPPLDSLRENFTPTDLKQLEAGLEARKSMLEVSRAEQGPEIFLFAKFDYTKAWVDNRTGDNQDVLITDPINSVSGALGIGFKWNVNWWIQQTKVRKADLEYQQLRRKEAYAKKGLTLLMEDAWLKYQALGEQLQAIDSSRTLAEGWLKSVAVSMDIDPSRAKDLVGPYKTWIDFESKYWEAVYQRNLAALDVLDQAGWLLRASEQLR